MSHYSTAFLCLIVFLKNVCSMRSYTFEKSLDDELHVYRQKTKDMFYHAYRGYMKHAYPLDELRPLTCDGVNTWGNYSLTLVDALDTLAVLGDCEQFRKVSDLVLKNLDPYMNVNVSVFETNIRVIGGLISAHLLSHRCGLELEPGWPCDGPLLSLAVEFAERILLAFGTKTGMPYGSMNLLRGVSPDETPITCTASVGTFILEFGALSRLTGDPLYEKTALRALNALNSTKSKIGLVGNHVNIQTGEWTARDAGIGAGVDSFFEYLVKGANLLRAGELMKVFSEHRQAIYEYLKKGNWYFWADMKSGSTTLPIFQSLEAFWPGIETMTGDLDSAYKTLYHYFDVWHKFGMTPEFFRVDLWAVLKSKEGYPLRPELVESIMYLYRATKDPELLKMGMRIFDSIEKTAKTECGYATIKDVRDHTQENRMESFFLAETVKYLYLLFDPDNFLHSTGQRAVTRHTSHGKCVLGAGGYIFNTEAHPIDPSALHCCSERTRDIADAVSVMDTIFSHHSTNSAGSYDAKEPASSFLKCSLPRLDTALNFYGEMSRT